MDIKKKENVKILVVEDEYLTYHAVKAVLEKNGFSVLPITTTGEAAILKVKEAAPDLVLMDIWLEGEMDGIDAAGKIHEFSTIPIIYLTALADSKSIERAKISEPYGYIIKPCDEYTLSTTIDMALYKHHINELMRQELEKLVAERTKALEESQANYRNLFENSPVGIFKVSVDGRILMANPAFLKILGYASLEEIPRVSQENPWFSAVESQNTFKQKLEQEGEVKGIEEQWTTKDNQVIFARKNTRAIKDKGGNILYYEGTVEDITRQKKAEEKARQQEQQLIQADKMIALGTLVSGVAHEINNPNNFIMMNTPLLLELWQEICPILERYYETSGDFSIKGFNYSELKRDVPGLFAGIINGAKRIKNIVRDLKDFARPGTDDIDQDVDINQVVKTAVNLTSTMIEKSTLHFSIHYGMNIPGLKGNFQRLEQVLVNLIENSCQALPDKEKRIAISTGFDEQTGSITVKVKDEGMGIEPRQVKFILDPFFTTRRESGGIGLGLSISAAIINRHGGTLSFDSQPGKGTTATITLPVPGVQK
jgi:PAS domain S-box-containing protein